MQAPSNTTYAEEEKMIGQTTVGTDSTVVLAKNPMRTVLYLCNDSDEDIYIAIDEDAVLNQGINLQIGMPPVVLKDGDAGLRGAINAIGTSGQKNLSWLAL